MANAGATDGVSVPRLSCLAGALPSDGTWHPQVGDCRFCYQATHRMITRMHVGSMFAFCACITLVLGTPHVTSVPFKPVRAKSLRSLHGVWAQDAPVHVIWAALVRAAVSCHQRRGDSDAVAHCLYQLLALDLAAPEWDAML